MNTHNAPLLNLKSQILNLQSLWTSFRMAAWLGWQIESNWTDPLLFAIYSIIKPLAGASILVVMYSVINHADFSSPVFPYIYLGNAFYFYVGGVMTGVSWAIIDDREHYRTLKYIYIAPISVPTYLFGRAVARFVTTTFSVMITITCGVLFLHVPIHLAAVDWPLFIVSLLIGVLMLASVFFVLGIYLAVRFIHRRPFRTLITPARSIAWGRLFQGFGAWFVLAGLMSVLEALLYPGRYVWTLDLKRFIPFVFLALILVPIQTSAEEFFFRGYILQGVGLRVRNIWILTIVSGVLFMVPHLLNPEASVNYALMGVYYFSMGAFLAYITLRDGRLELALGVHAANNLFSTLFANYTVTVIPSPSLFTVNVLDAAYSVPAALIGMGIFVFLLIGPLRLKSTIENTGN